MQLWQDGLLAMLAAVGLASLLWAVVKAVLYPDRKQRRSIVAMIPARGDGKDLEQQVAALGCMRKEQDVFGMVLLVDCGLSEEGRRISQLIARKERWVTVCGPEEAGRYLNCG